MKRACLLWLAILVALPACTPVPEGAMGSAEPAGGGAPEAPTAPDNWKLKLLGITSGHALVATDRQSYQFAKGEAHMLKCSSGFMLIKCVAMTSGTASFLIDDLPNPVQLRPHSSAFKMSAGSSR